MNMALSTASHHAVCQGKQGCRQRLHPGVMGHCLPLFIPAALEVRGQQALNPCPALTLCWAVSRFGHTSGAGYPRCDAQWYLSHLTRRLFFLLKTAIRIKIKSVQGESSISVKMFIKNIFALNLFTAKTPKISQSNCHYLLELFYGRKHLFQAASEGTSLCLVMTRAAPGLPAGGRVSSSRDWGMSVCLCLQEEGQRPPGW